MSTVTLPLHDFTGDTPNPSPPYDYPAVIVGGPEALASNDTATYWDAGSELNGEFTTETGASGTFDAAAIPGSAIISNPRVHIRWLVFSQVHDGGALQHGLGSSASGVMWTGTGLLPGNASGGPVFDTWVDEQYVPAPAQAANWTAAGLSTGVREYEGFVEVFFGRQQRYQISYVALVFDWRPAEAPPLRQRQRDDGIGASAPRMRSTGVRPSSRQRSIRQGWRGTYL